MVHLIKTNSSKSTPHMWLVRSGSEWEPRTQYYDTHNEALIQFDKCKATDEHYAYIDNWLIDTNLHIYKHADQH